MGAATGCSARSAQIHLSLEFDNAGTFVGGTFAWATARDWARLGYLYLKDGRWANQQLLPDDWVEFSRTPSKAANNTAYGAHFWISAEPTKQQRNVLPADLNALVMNGSRGQLVVIVPDRDLVVVRLGEMHNTSWQRVNQRVEQLVRAFPKRAASHDAITQSIDHRRILFVLGVVGAWIFLVPQLEIGAGYAAKQLCSCMYIGKREFAECKSDLRNGIERFEMHALSESSGARAEVFPVVRAEAYYLKEPVGSLQ